MRCGRGLAAVPVARLPLDVARHFMPKAGVLRFLDLMAAHRLNVLHFHLTDDQGWRDRGAGVPPAHEVGAWRAGSWVGRPPDGTPGHDGRPHGGYYTVDDLREIVAYAAARHITVVPEIDVPGHSQAAIAAYPWLGVTGAPLEVLTSWGINENVLAMTDEIVDFYRQVLTHVTEIFPSEVICVGGDEVPTTQWAADPATVSTRGRPRTVRCGRAARLVHRPAGRPPGVAGPPRLRMGRGPGPRPAARDAIVASGRAPSGGVAARPATTSCCARRSTCTWTTASPTTPTSRSRSATSARWRTCTPTNHWLPHGGTGRAGPGVDRTPGQPPPRGLRGVPAAGGVRGSGVEPSGPRVRGVRARLVRHHLPRLDALGVEYRPLAGPHPWQTRPGVPGRIRPL